MCRSERVKALWSYKNTQLFVKPFAGENVKEKRGRRQMLKRVDNMKRWDNMKKQTGRSIINAS